jgi:hypothetical protein
MKLVRYFTVCLAAAALLACMAAPVALSSAPSIVKATFRLSYAGGPVATTYINARLLVRDDSRGSLKFRVREKQPTYDWTRYRVFWRQAPRYYGLRERWYALRWKAPDRFWGGGYYKLRIAVRDSEDLWSNAVYHTWNIGD